MPQILTKGERFFVAEQAVKTRSSIPVILVWKKKTQFVVFVIICGYVLSVAIDVHLWLLSHRSDVFSLLMHKLHMQNEHRSVIEHILQSVQSNIL